MNNRLLQTFSSGETFMFEFERDDKNAFFIAHFSKIKFDGSKTKKNKLLDIEGAIILSLDIQDYIDKIKNCFHFSPPIIPDK